MNDYLSNLVKCFNNSNLGVNLTTILIDNEPWFIAKEVASILKYTNLKKAINRNVNEADQRMLSYEECKGLFGDSLEIEEDIEATESLENTEDLKGCVNTPLEKPIKISNFGVKIINESGLYDLILEAKKKEAKAFRRWVTSEVLPSIRKNGSYGVAISEEDRLKLNVVNADSVEERSSALSELSQYYKAQKQALEAENEELKNTNDELLTENELWRGNYFNTKQIYDTLKREYPESLKQAESTNYNKLRKGLCDITNEKRQGRKVYKKHVKNDKGENEWRQEYYFERNILDTIIERVKENIKYIFNIRLR